MLIQTENVLQYKTKTGKAAYFLHSERRIQNPAKRLSKEVTSLEVTIFQKAPS